MLRLEKFVKKEIESRLNESEYDEIYLGDLSFKLFESEYSCKSYYCSSYRAINWIKEYFEELSEVVEEYEEEFGSSVPNPFTEPEKFQLTIITYLADKILLKAIYNAGLDIDERVELTSKVINDIIEAL